jgi:hypothetical protein
MSQDTKRLLLGCIPVITHMSKIKPETISQFNVNLHFGEWYSFSYNDLLRVRQNDRYMKNVTAPEGLNKFMQQKNIKMNQMSLNDLLHVLVRYCKELYDIDMEEYDLNPKASRWMTKIITDIKETIDKIPGDTEVIYMQKWLDQCYTGLFEHNGWRIVPTHQQPTNTAYHSFGGGERMVCMTCSKIIDH